MKINKDWRIHNFDVGQSRDLEVASTEYIDYFWMKARVPGDVHSTLIEKRIIEDPFFGHNDKKCQWVEEKVWWYRTNFEFHDELEVGEKVHLVFEGLDTYATIYLNGVELGSTENMFISHEFEVTRELLTGKNIIAVKFEPISHKVHDKVQYYWSGFSKKRIWTRKAQFHYGWDWGPRLVTAGIWKDVRLEKRKHANIDHVFARTVNLTEKQAEIDIDVQLEVISKEKQYVAEISLIDGEQSYTKKVPVQGKEVKTTLQIEEPKLWWTHDLGEPYLYELQVTLFVDGEEIDKNKEAFGIRTIEVQRVNEVGDHSFTFILNGVKLFAKGANWIPVDSFVASTPDSRYQQLVMLAKEANMNMLRVWGGGIYEREVFYNQCNKLGILVWQDFMFSCALYPDYNKNFMRNVKEEIIHIVKRLRNHPSLALWCGNNENDWLYEALYSSGEIKHPFYGEKIYHELMPEILEELDPTRLFWPSSPYGGNDHNSREQGDSHNWQVWHGNIEPRVFGEPQTVNYSVEGLSFKNFKNDHTTFASEFGMHASSNRYTLESNIPSDSFYWCSDEMAYRNKDIHHPKGILLMEGYTGIPNNINEYMNFSMLTQAEGLKYGIEHYRRNGRTSGALVWQLNDCWPGTSWSVIDYYLLPKASYYYARKFFAPILLTLEFEQGQSLKVWAVNDRNESYEDEVTLSVLDFDGNEHFSKVIFVSLAKLEKRLIDLLSEEEILQDLDPKKVCVVLRSKHGKAYDNYYYLRDHKELELPNVKLDVRVDHEKQEVSIQTDKFARMVKIDLNLKYVRISDNFFDLIPGEEKIVKIEHPDHETIPWETLNISAINMK